MLGLRPRAPLTLKRKVWAVAQHVAMPVDWPTALLSGLGLSPTLQVLESEVESHRPLGTAAALRIGFASDLHAGPTTHPEQIDRAMAALAAARPDIILLGGDFVGHRPSDVRRLIPGLRSLTAPLGLFAVLGNHDNNTHPELVADTLRGAGVRVLINEAVTLPAPFQRTRLAGLDDHGTGAPDASSFLRDDGGTTILMIHQPSGVLDAEGASFQLALAGHTHGGQIVLPNGFAPITPSGALSRRYLAGRYVLPTGGTLLVSRGVGASTVPMRVNAPADLLLVTLRGSTAPADR
jgi:uncharacterized protein